MASVVLAVDVGGTTTAAGLVTPAGEIIADAQAPTGGDVAASETIQRLIRLMWNRAVEGGAAVAGIGVGVPGIVDPASGRIGEEIHHVPDLAGRTLGAALARQFGVPAFVDNDVNALAIGEWWFGAGRGTRSLVVLAPGTGFGAGIVLDGRLVRGAHGFGGEFGHTPVKFDGRSCWCGGRGCLAVYASGRGIADAARARGLEGEARASAAGADPSAITAEVVFARAHAGDPIASIIVEEAVRALGAMIATIVNGLNPETIVVTGGVAASYAALDIRIRAAVAEHAFARALAATRIVFAPGDKHVSVRGAAALALHEAQRAEETSRRCCEQPPH